MFSRQLFKRVKMEGSVKVNKRTKELWKPLKNGDEVTVCFPLERRGKSLKPVPAKLMIVYEDDDLIVLDKPSGIPVLPGGVRNETSLADHLVYYYEKNNMPFTVHIVTRLDRDTSGLLVVAKHSYSHHLLTRKRDMIQRYYEAIVEGNVEMDSGKLTEPIARKEGSIIERETSASGKSALTLFQVVKRYGRFTKVCLQLKTGRTHQIRVHMSAIGHPLAGDTLYGGGKLTHLHGQALHCNHVQFEHPWTEERLAFTIPTPDSWDKIHD